MSQQEFVTGSNYAPGGNASGGEGIGAILSGLLRDLQDMVRGEVALARAEIKEDVGTATKGLASIAMAGVVALTGFIFLMLAVTYLLNIWMRMWIAAGIVGLVLLAIGGIAFASGKSKLSATNLKPDQTIDSVKENTQWAKQQMS
ncbi:MAG: phage holin family protein [Chloroflexota bacterium]|nr:phage holin family protein [Chloroflexota bacterium]